MIKLYTHYSHNDPWDRSSNKLKCNSNGRSRRPFLFIFIYTLLSLFITEVGSVNKPGAPFSPIKTTANIAANKNEEPFLNPFTPSKNTKLSEATRPNIDKYLSNLLQSLEKISNETRNEFKLFEEKSKVIEDSLPFGTDFVYDDKDKEFVVSDSKPVSLGGIFQSILDKETELRYKFRNNIHIDYKIQTYVTEGTSNVIKALQNKNLADLRTNHHLVFSRLIEPLRVILALKRFAKDQLRVMELFNKAWYEGASPSVKLNLVTRIDQLVQSVPTYAAPESLFTKVSATKSFLNSKHTKDLIDIETEIRVQKIIREYMQGVRVIRHYTNFTSLYLAPYYVDLVPTLGSPWLNHLFHKYYVETAYASERDLSENLPLLITRFLSLVEQNAITVTNPNFQKSIYLFSSAVSAVMNEKQARRNVFTRDRYYGFMDMCDEVCEKRINAELTGTLDKMGSRVGRALKRVNVPKKQLVTKNLKLIRWVMLYQKSELMKIETLAEKVLIQLILRTNGIDSSQYDEQHNVKLDIDIKHVKPHDPQHQNIIPPSTKSFLETRVFKRIKSFGRKTSRRLTKNAYRTLKRTENSFRKFRGVVKRTPLARWIISKVDSLKREYIFVCPAFNNVLKPKLGLDNNIISTHIFIKDLVQVKNVDYVLSDWYNHTMETWIQLSSAHSSLHGFDPQEDKSVYMSKSLGAVFRWLNSINTTNLVFTNREKTVLASLSLQLALFLDNSVRGYRRGILGKLWTKIKNVFRMGRTSTVPANWRDLNDALEPKALVTRPKFSNGINTVNTLVRLFKERFIRRSSMPARLTQVIVTFVGMWAKNQEKEFDLTSSAIEPVRKHFYTSLLSNKGIPKDASDIIIKHCRVKSRRKALHLGCINKVNGKKTKCNPVVIRLTRFFLLPVIEELQGSLDDPLDMLRMASDLSNRCIAHNTQKRASISLKNNLVNRIKKKFYGQEEYTSLTLLASEFSQRLHCYNLQKKVARNLASKLRRLTDVKAIKTAFETLMNEYQAMEIKMKSQSDFGSHKLMCQFMNANNPELAKIYKARLLKHALKGRFYDKVSLNDNDLNDIVSSQLKSQAKYAKEVNNYQSYVLVGTRFFNSINYRGGYPPNRLFESQEQVMNNGQRRNVFNGNSFVDELDELKITDDLENITVHVVPGENYYRRYYHLISGEKLDEYQYGVRAKNFTVTGSVLTTSRALAENGYESGMIIWCGYKYGWVADFALRDVIHDINAVPLFNGRNWVLSTEARVKDFIGGIDNNTYGISKQNLEKKVKDVNVIYKFNNGHTVDAKNDNKTPEMIDILGEFAPSNTLQENQPPVFSTTSTDLTPGAVQNFVKNSEFQPENDTLIIDLNAPEFVVNAKGSGIDLIQFTRPPNVKFERQDFQKEV